MSIPRAIPVGQAVEAPPVVDWQPAAKEVPVARVTQFPALEWVATFFRVVAILLVIELVAYLVVGLGGVAAAGAAGAKAGPGGAVAAGGMASVVVVGVLIVVTVGHVIAILGCVAAAELLRIAVIVAQSAERSAHYSRYAAQR